MRRLAGVVFVIAGVLSSCATENVGTTYYQDLRNVFDDLQKKGMFHPSGMADHSFASIVLQVGNEHFVREAGAEGIITLNSVSFVVTYPTNYDSECHRILPLATEEFVVTYPTNEEEVSCPEIRPILTAKLPGRDALDEESVERVIAAFDRFRDRMRLTLTERFYVNFTHTLLPIPVQIYTK